MKISKIKFTDYLLLLGIIGVFVFFSATQKNFMTASNILEILRQGSIYFILLAGMTWVMSVGEIDCSFPDIAACASTLMAVMMNQSIPTDVAVIISVAICVLFGVLSGILVTKFRFSAIIVTIAVASIAKALGLIVSGGKNVSIKIMTTPSFFKALGAAKIGPVPVILIAGIVVCIVMWFLQERKRFGQYAYAIADNRMAALNAGIKVDKIVRIVFIMSAVLAAIGGCVIGLNAQSGRPFMGSQIFLDSFTKVFLGALIIRVGKTNIIGTYIGCIFLQLIANGLTFVGMSSSSQSIVTGALLVAGVTVTGLLDQKRHLRSQME